MSKRSRQINRRRRTVKKKKNNLTIIAVIVIIFAVGISVGYYRSNSDSQPEQGLSADLIAKGEKLFSSNCTACHGIKGRGAYDRTGNLLATPMDETGHAWHHIDEYLVNTILNGSPANPKMIAWKSMLSEDDAVALVEYIKSLWSPRIRNECQGPKHMRCMQGMM